MASAARADCASTRVDTRILCLGNDLLQDDSFGHIVAERLVPCALPDIEIVPTCDAGFRLLDYALDTRRLVVVDSVLTGKASVGTVYVFRDDELRTAGGTSPHYVGLYESILLGRTLGLPVADEVVIVGVEIADCWTFGGTLHPAVRAAIPEVVQIVCGVISGGSSASMSTAPSVPEESPPAYQ